MDRVADLYQGRALVASADVADPAGAQLGQKYASNSKARAIVFFTRDGRIDTQSPTITEDEAKQILDRLLK